MIIARLVQMPEAYWAQIATLVVMQSTLGATLTLSIERIVATAVGASVEQSRRNFSRQIGRVPVAIFLVGLLSIAFRLEKTASLREHYAHYHRLIPRLEAPWAIALHRFIEVSVGIIVALAVVALWPEHRPPSSDSTAE